MRPNRNMSDRRGAAVILIAFLMVAIAGITAFVTDIGYIRVSRAELQNAADGAAMAAALAISDDNSPDGQVFGRQQANLTASANLAAHYGNTLKDSDLKFGLWNPDTGVFTATTSKPEAVEVVLRRSQANDNPLPLFFAKVFGHQTADINVRAIAAIKPGDKPRVRFLIDDEMIDSDIESIEDLAQANNVPPDDLISDGDNDGFIDLPPGATLEVPTGQVGDEGMVDVAKWDAFPFEAESEYSTLDFIAEGTVLEQTLGTKKLQDVEWNSSNAPHPNLVGSKVLDPVPSVDPMSSHAEIMALPDPNGAYVSPVFKSDVSMAETDPSKYGAPAANLQGERRGLIAFKIISARPNPAGGSYLPLVTIEILDPNSVPLVDVEVSGAGPQGGSMSLVQ